jgi:hypothetical protein
VGNSCRTLRTAAIRPQIVRKNRNFKWIVAGAAVATFVLANGCTTPAPKADRFVSAPAGTTMSYFRRSSGSFGVADGPVDWTLVDREWQGKAARGMVSPQAGTSLHDPASNNFGLLATLNRNGEPTASFDPPVGYRYPLEVGQVVDQQAPDDRVPEPRAPVL